MGILRPRAPSLVIQAQPSDNPPADSPAGILLQQLHEHPKDWRQRCGLAANPSTPPEVMEYLAADSKPMVRVFLAANRCCSPAVLDLLSYDRDIKVRRTVATNPACSPETLQRLAGDPDIKVARLVTDNPTHWE